MHFSKTYSKLLLDLPPDLRENAIQYRQLKKLINQVVLELSSLGLSPSLLHDLLEQKAKEQVDKAAKGKGKEKDTGEVPDVHILDQITPGSAYTQPRVVYEVNSKSGKIEPRLRIWITPPSSPVVDRSSFLESEDDGSSRASSVERGESEGHDEDVVTGSDHAQGDEGISSINASDRVDTSLLWALQRRGSESSERFANVKPLFEGVENESRRQEVIIPLVSDTAFFQLLSTALISLSDHLLTLHEDFVDTLTMLSREIGSAARPVSSASSSFQPHSILSSHPGAIRSPSLSNKSDLYSWREIFQLYVESEVFENVGEVTRGERSIEESEERLKLFAERVTKRGLGDGRELKLKQSRQALETFLKLNMFILNIKKFQHANAEATRKILKKHAKRTALPLPGPKSPPSSVVLKGGAQERLVNVLLPQLRAMGLDVGGFDTSAEGKALTVTGTTPAVSSAFLSLPRVLVQAIGETLLPIIPHIDDYSCVICTNIAFKPIRLNCGHLFCVRCLVKMQKRGQGDCPMCRAPTVLIADRSNVDWALLNFMSDWFPIESRDKLKASEKEAMDEQLLEMGLDPEQKCTIM